MRRRNKAKKRNMQSWILRLAVLAVGIYLSVYFIEGQIQISALAQELGEVEQELDDLSLKNEELTVMMEAENQDAYVERVAREEMDYVRPDDRVFVDISSD